MKHETISAPLARHAARVAGIGILLAATACSGDAAPKSHIDPETFTAQFEQMPTEAPAAVIKAAGATVRLRVDIPDYTYLGSTDTGVYLGNDEIVGRVYLGDPAFGLPDSASVMAIGGNGEQWLNGAAHLTGPSAATYNTVPSQPAYFKMGEVNGRHYLRDVPAARLSDENVKPGDIVWQTGFGLSERTSKDYYSPQIVASVVVAAEKHDFLAIPAAQYGTAAKPHKAQKIAPLGQLSDQGSPYFTNKGELLGIADQDNVVTEAAKQAYILPHIHGQKLPLEGGPTELTTSDSYNEVDKVFRVTLPVLFNVRKNAHALRSSIINAGY